MRSGSPHRDENRVSLDSSRIHCAVCSWNVSVCEFCSSFFRFMSKSRGSAPSASSRRPPAKPATLQIPENLLPDFLNCAPQLAAHRGFMHAQHARNLLERLPVQIVGGQQEPVLRFPLGQSSLQSRASSSESSPAGCSGAGSGAGASNSSIGSSCRVRR